VISEEREKSFIDWVIELVDRIFRKYKYEPEGLHQESKEKDKSTPAE
jgi:hypothetical protein